MALEAKKEFEAAKQARIEGDFRSSMSLLVRASEMGSAEAQFEYAWALEFGYGLEKSMEQAMVWYERSALSGFAPSMAHLSELKRDAGAEDESLEWGRRALASGNAYAQGFVYDTGLLGPVDAERARVLFEQAAGFGFPFAQESLGVILQESNPEDPEILAHFTAAAAYGLPISQLALGDLFRTGSLVAKDLFAAFSLYWKGALFGDPVCMVTAAEVLYADVTLLRRVFPGAGPFDQWSIPASMLSSAISRFVEEFGLVPDLLYDRLPFERRNSASLLLSSREARLAELFQFGRLFRSTPKLLEVWRDNWRFQDDEDTERDVRVLVSEATAECLGCHADSTRVAKRAAYALLVIHHRRVPCLFTKYLPRDLGRAIAKLVFASRVYPHMWLNHPAASSKPAQKKQRKDEEHVSTYALRNKKK